MAIPHDAQAYSRVRKASSHGELDVVQDWLKDPNLSEHWLYQVLLNAAYHGQLVVIEAVLPRVDLKPDNPQLLIQAIYGNHPSTFFRLLDLYDPALDHRALETAINEGRYDMAKALLPRSDVNEPRLRAIDRAAHQGHLKILKLLFDQGATWPLSHKPLVSAASRGHMGVLRELFKREESKAEIYQAALEATKNVKQNCALYLVKKSSFNAEQYSVLLMKSHENGLTVLSHLLVDRMGDPCQIFVDQLQQNNHLMAEALLAYVGPAQWRQALAAGFSLESYPHIQAQLLADDLHQLQTPSDQSHRRRF